MTGTMLIALSSLSLAAPGAGQDRASDEARLTPLHARKDRQGAYCTVDRKWCVTLISGQDGPQPIVRPYEASSEPKTQAQSGATEDAPESVWPFVILLKRGGFLAGVQIRTSTGYSGGGGSATELQLYDTFADGKPGSRAVFKQPIESTLMIRACFSEKDMRKRRGACHDEYGFSADLGLTSGMTGGLPVLTYTTKAWAFPRGASRSRDSTTMPGLRQADLVRSPDARCSFSRRFRFDPEEGLYRPDTPLPDCDDFTTP